MTNKYTTEFDKSHFVEISQDQFRYILSNHFEMYREYFIMATNDVLSFYVPEDYDESILLDNPTFIKEWSGKIYIDKDLYEDCIDGAEDEEIAEEIERDVEEYRAKKIAEAKLSRKESI